MRKCYGSDRTFEHRIKYFIHGVTRFVFVHFYITYLHGMQIPKLLSIYYYMNLATFYIDDKNYSILHKYVMVIGFSMIPSKIQ